MEWRGCEVRADAARSREKRNNAVRMSHGDGVFVEPVGLVCAILLARIHLHDDGWYGNFDRCDGDLVAVRDVIQLLETIGAGIKIHRQRRHCGDTLHFRRVPRSIPKNDECGRPRRDEVDSAGQQGIVHDGGATEINPTYVEVWDTCLLSLPLN